MRAARKLGPLWSHASRQAWARPVKNNLRNISADTWELANARRSPTGTLIADAGSAPARPTGRKSDMGGWKAET